MWGRLGALIVKEFLAVWKDRRSRYVLIGPPVIQLLVFGYAATYDLNHIATAVYDEDGGGAARTLLSRFTGAPPFEEVRRLRRTAEIREVIDAKDALLVIHLGPTFSADLRAGRPARVQLVVDGRNSNTALIVLGYANAVIEDFNREWAREHGLDKPRGRIVTRAWYNPNLESRWFFVPGIVALLTMVVVMVVTALSVAREREIGTFEQLLVTPLRPGEILIGKAAPAIVIGLGEGAFIVTVAVGWFGIPFVGSLALLFASLFVFLLSIVGIGLMVSSFARTQQQAIFGAFFFVVPAVILSGFGTPIANMPGWVQALTLVNPMRYFLEIVRGLFLQDMAPLLVLDRIWPMLLIALVTATAATASFRRGLQ